MEDREGQNLNQDAVRRPPASDGCALALVTRRMEDAARRADVTVDDLIAETLIAQAEMVGAEFGDHLGDASEGHSG
jgi:hypothetical protein